MVIVKKMAAIGFFIFLMACNSRSGEYHSALGDIPSRIDPADSHVNFALYIIKQLNEPLFEYKTFNRPVSRILENWQPLQNGAGYQLCIKRDVEFSNCHPLTPTILKENLEYFEERGYLKGRIDRIEENDNCLNVFFDKPYPQFPSDMMSYKTSIVDSATRGERIVVGISPYYIAEMNEKYIHLRSRKQLRFKEVYFHYWRPNDGEPLYKYDDINLIFERDLPKDIDRYLNRYNVTLLKTEDVIINHPDIEVRRYLFNCLDADRLRRIIHPERNSFLDIGGIVPVGMIGEVRERAPQLCPAKPFARPVTVKMLTFYEDSVGEFEGYFEEVLKPLNIHVEVKGIDASSLVSVMSSADKDYDLTIIGLGAYQSASSAQFSIFLPGENMWTKIRNQRVETGIEVYNNSSSDEDKDRAIRDANKALIDNYQVIPLLQTERPFYFSKKIGAINSDQLFLGIPKISEL